MKRWQFVLLLAFLLLCSACGRRGTPTYPAQTQAAAAIGPTPTQTRTPVPTETITPGPTATRVPTGPPTPTIGPVPSDTPAAALSEKGTAAVKFRLYEPGSKSILPANEGQAFSGAYSDPGAVVFHDGQFHMFFNNLHGYPPRVVNIGHAVSGDGLSWKLASQVPVLSSADVPFASSVVLASDALVEDDGTWVLYFYTSDEELKSGISVIGKAQAPSPDGPWNVHPEPLVEGSPDGWDEYAVQRPTVVKNTDGYSMYFQGADRKGASMQFGMATSPDGNTWDKHPDPVFQGSDVTWGDYISVRYPYVIPVDGGWLLFFRAEGDRFSNSIGIAESSDGVSWSLAQELPVLELEDYPEWRSLFVDKVIQAGETTYLYLELGAGSRTYINVATYEGLAASGENDIETAVQIEPSFTDAHGVPMMLVPAGEFTMGSDRGNQYETPHLVYLDDYYIDQYEVTNTQFAAFLNEMGNQEIDGTPWFNHGSAYVHVYLDGETWEVEGGYENYPVVEVTWSGADAFCGWRGGQLPTEAQWEKAARGEEGRSPFPWGRGVDCEIANFDRCGLQAPLPVDSFPNGVSPYGVFNMAGNVGEFTADWFRGDYYLDSPYENPTGPEDSDNGTKASRGGSWYSTTAYLKTYRRVNEFRPNDALRNVGFRCAAYP